MINSKPNVFQSMVSIASLFLSATAWSCPDLPVEIRQESKDFFRAESDPNSSQVKRVQLQVTGNDGIFIVYGSGVKDHFAYDVDEGKWCLEQLDRNGRSGRPKICVKADQRAVLSYPGTRTSFGEVRFHPNGSATVVRYKNGASANASILTSFDPVQLEIEHNLKCQDRSRSIFVRSVRRDADGSTKELGSVVAVSAPNGSRDGAVSRSPGLTADLASPFKFAKNACEMELKLLSTSLSNPGSGGNEGSASGAL